LARTCLKFCFDEDVLSTSVVVDGNQQKDAEASKLDSDVLENICFPTFQFIFHFLNFLRLTASKITLNQFLKKADSILPGINNWVIPPNIEFFRRKNNRFA
jgi:hypothetical protein